MGKTNRNAPITARSSDARFTLDELDREFPDDATCLEYLVAKLYPDGIHCAKCAKVTKHHRVRSRPAYACQFCGSHEYPMKGTIFEGSSTSLRLWFYAIFLMASTRCGISAKQLEREVGVSYPTAWRMFNKIRTLLADDGEPFGGTVEIDEADIGPQAKWMHAADKRRKNVKYGDVKHRTHVMGFAQRGADGKSGKVKTQIVTGSGAPTLLPEVERRVLPASAVYSDEWRAYDTLGQRGYEHHRVRHSLGVYVLGDVHTNTIEGFWSLLKRGLSGVYHGVSTKHLQSYMDEYTFRYNNRDATGRGMFDAFASRIEKNES